MTRTSLHCLHVLTHHVTRLRTSAGTTPLSLPLGSNLCHQGHTALSKSLSTSLSRKVRAAQEEMLQPIGDVLPLRHQRVRHPVWRDLVVVILAVVAAVDLVGWVV